MKIIKKSSSPLCFEGWKAKSLEDNYTEILENNIHGTYTDKDLVKKLNGKKKWENFNPKTKDKVKIKQKLRKHLEAEQGKICCFCGKRLTGTSEDEIEHLRPKSRYKRLQFDYFNLALSCSGNTKYSNGSKERHCNNAKHSKLMIKDPVRSEEWEEELLYDLSGNVRAQKYQYKEVIEILNLNCNTLKNKRKAAIKGFLSKIDKYEKNGITKYKMINDISLDEEELEKISRKINKKDENNEYYPYCKAISDSLKLQKKKIELKKIVTLISDAEEGFKKKLEKYLDTKEIPELLKEDILNVFINK